jgi:hypothetical protein
MVTHSTLAGMSTVALTGCVDPDSSVGPDLCAKLEDASGPTCTRHPDWCTLVGCSDLAGQHIYGCPTSTALADDGAVRRAGRACESAGGVWIGPEHEYWDTWEEHGICEGGEWDVIVICDTSEPVAPNE